MCAVQSERPSCHLAIRWPKLQEAGAKWRDRPSASLKLPRISVRLAALGQLLQVEQWLPVRGCHSGAATVTNPHRDNRGHQNPYVFFGATIGPTASGTSGRSLSATARTSSTTLDTRVHRSPGASKVWPLTHVGITQALLPLSMSSLSSCRAFPAAHGVGRPWHAQFAPA